jgi:hypothetical protein
MIAPLEAAVKQPQTAHTQIRRPIMNPPRTPRSEKSRKSRTRPDGRRTFTPDVDRLEPRISLSSLIPTGNPGHIIPPPLGLSANHNETLVRARTRPPRKPNQVGRRNRRPLAPAVEGLEPRISLSCLIPTGNSGHVIAPPLGTQMNHNETLVRARPPRKPNQAGRRDRRQLAPAVEGLERRISLSSLSPSFGSGHVVACGREYNHNETLVRTPRRGRR